MSGPGPIGAVRPLATRLPPRPSGEATDAGDGRSGERGDAALAGRTVHGLAGSDTGAPSPRDGSERWFVRRESEDGTRERRALADEASPWRSVRGRSILEREATARTLELTVATTRSDGVWNLGGSTRTSGYRFFDGGRFERFLRLLHESDAGGEDRQHAAIHRDAGGAQLVAEVNASLGEGSASVTTRLGAGDARATDDVPDAFANGGAVDGERDVTDAFAAERTGDGEGDVAAAGGYPALRGRYETRGNTLVLHFDDGRTRAELFADLGNAALMIGHRLRV